MTLSGLYGLGKGLYFVVLTAAVAPLWAVEFLSSPPPTCAEAVAIGVGQEIQTLLDAHPEGTSFCLEGGVHRLKAPLAPKHGQSLLGEPGAVLNGSKVLTDFVREGGAWVAYGQTQRLPVHGECFPNNNTCRYAEHVFVDGKPLQQVMTLAELATGTFYFDYANSKIHLFDNPAGKLVETTTSQGAVGVSAPTANHVTVRNLLIEKFGNRAQTGAVYAYNGAGWIVENNEVRFNHGIGVRTGSRSVVRGNYVHHNGQLGLAGSGTNLLVEDNEIAYNNTAGFDFGWEAGGTKWTLTDGLVVRGNYSHDNNGAGLWTDIDNIDTLYENNRVVNNSQTGIFHEISYAAVIRDNTVEGNGFGHFVWGYGAGIQVAGSPDVEVYGNTVVGNANHISLIQQARGTGAYGPHEIENAHVHHNTITMDATAGLTGMFVDIGDNTYFTSRNNTFNHNTYYLGDSTYYFRWAGNRTTAEWIGSGNDTSGIFNCFGRPRCGACGHDCADFAPTAAAMSPRSMRSWASTGSFEGPTPRFGERASVASRWVDLAS